MTVRSLISNPKVLWLILIVVYFTVRLPGLTALPIFADEAIYIRWSQLLLSDWRQYLLFPINDGKTPLFIWMMAPFLWLIPDPLLAGRLLAVCGGLVQLVLTVKILQTFRVSRVGQVAGALVVILAPFWYFHQRMALMDGWMTVWLSLAVLATAKVCTQNLSTQRRRLWMVMGIAAVWAGLMTKVPFVLAMPSLFIMVFSQQLGGAELRSKLLQVSVMLIGGVVLFSLLAITPVFPQLAARGSDFLLPLEEVFSGRWKETVPSIPTHLGYFHQYLGWGALVLAGIAVLVRGKRRVALALLLSFILFCLPIWILGRVVFPRYLFPATIFLTLLAGIGADTLWTWSNHRINTSKRKLAFRLLTALLLFQVATTGLSFIVPSVVNTSTIPFVPSDVGQYLNSWSSGHGILETYNFLSTKNAIITSGKIFVATEGNFGSLPDALLVYNERHALEYVWIEGIGYPVNSIPTSFASRISEGDSVLLVINSDRLKWNLEPKHLLMETCRPLAASCLQVWDITSTYRSLQN